ncbi:flagellin lysine-N-methylase [Edwardsiella tarda]|uniref:flagellin lysine-N-methylase n=1 Tax=Edwardsiella tarda TaxID=636 RepID=UPI00105751D9|nr:flagellin lysine-N-methylase [Edwardsiella tarda]UCQ55418.1 flagellin lysine-N-methylase [Edwardsiella tarda]
MQYHKIITPNFYRLFACSGSHCIDNCCNSWSISIDKQTYKKYINTPHPHIRQLAKDNLLLTRSGNANYAIVKLDEQGKCPLLSTDGLCQVHATLGSAALSKTCRTFPRLSRNIGDQTRHSMTLACSEVVRLVMFSHEGMHFSEETQLRPVSKGKLTNSPPRWQAKHQLISLFFTHLAHADSPSIDNNLLALTSFTLYLQKLDFNIEEHLAEIENFYAILLQSLTNGTLGERDTNKQQNDTVKSKLKLNTLILLGSNINQTSRGSGYLQANHRAIADFLDVNNPESNLAEKFSQLNQQWHTLCESKKLRINKALRNLLSYHIYNRALPGENLENSFHLLYQLIIDYFYLKTSLSVLSLGKEIEEVDIVRFVSYYHIIHEHNEILKKALIQQIQDINFNDYISCVLFLE